MFAHICLCLKSSLGFPSGSVVNNLSALQEMQIRSLGQEDALEKEMATHSSILAWEFPRADEPGGLIVREITKESNRT